MLLANDVESILKSGIKRKRRTTRNNRNIRNTTRCARKNGNHCDHNEIKNVPTSLEKLPRSFPERNNSQRQLGPQKPK